MESIKGFLSALYKAGVRYTAYHEDNSVTVMYEGQNYNIKAVKLNKDGSVRYETKRRK